MKPFYLITTLLLAGTCGANGPKDLFENLDSSLRLRIAAYPSKPGPSDIDILEANDSSRTMEIKYDWASWCETEGGIRLNTSGWIEFGVPRAPRWAGAISLFQDKEMLSRPIVLNELYVIAPFGNLDFVVGRAVRRNSLAVLYPLADRYVARDFNDPINPKILGTWQARLDYYLNEWEFSIAALPVFQPPKIPSIESRWWLRRFTPVLGSPVPPGITNGRLERILPDVEPENMAGLATVRAHLHGLDFFTSAYYGYSPYAVGRTAMPTPDFYEVTLEYLPGFESATGVSTVFGPLELHSEVLYHHTASGDDDDYISGLGGGILRSQNLSSWMHCDQVHLIVEYAREHLLKEQSATSGYDTSSKPFRFGRNTLLTELLAEINNRDTAVAAVIYDLEQENTFLQLRYGHRFGNGFRLEFVSEFFFGSGLYLGEWSSNDRFYLNAEYHF